MLCVCVCVCCFNSNFLLAGRVLFQRSFPAEVSEWATNDGTTINLPCLLTGVSREGGLEVFFLKNGERIFPSTQRNGGVYIETTLTDSWKTLVIERRRGSEGVYQCVGLVESDDSTAITTSTYVNIYCEQ